MSTQDKLLAVRVAEPPPRIEIQALRKHVYDPIRAYKLDFSPKEQRMVDAWLATQSTQVCTQVINDYMTTWHRPRPPVSVLTVKRWLSKPKIAHYLADRLMDKGLVDWYTKEKWKADGVRVQAGLKKMDSVTAAMWREYGRMAGWSEESQPTREYGKPIRVIQADGTA